MVEVEYVRADIYQGAVKALGAYQRAFSHIEYAVHLLDGPDDAVDAIIMALDAVRGR